METFIFSEIFRIFTGQNMLDLQSSKAMEHILPNRSHSTTNRFFS